MTLAGKRVLLTGGSGFIASHLCRRLVQEHAQVYVAVKYNSVIDNIRLVNIWDRITPVEMDLRNTDSVAQVREIKPQIIFHLAAYNHVGDSFLHIGEAMHSNCIGTVNLLEAYHDYDCFVYTTTSEVYGYQASVPFTESMTPFPMSPYALGKYAGELYAQLKWKSHQRPIVMVRPFNAFGPYQSPRAIIAELIIRALTGEPLITTEGKQTRDFNYVENLVDGFIAAATTPAAIGEIINIGSGEEVSIADLVKTIHRVAESASALRIGELPYRKGEIWRMCADSQKARTILGWSPRVDWKNGLALTVNWYRQYIEEFTNRNSGLSRLA